jgi:hypothetical protein
MWCRHYKHCFFELTGLSLFPIQLMGWWAHKKVLFFFFLRYCFWKNNFDSPRTRKLYRFLRNNKIQFLSPPWNLLHFHFFGEILPFCIHCAEFNISFLKTRKMGMRMGRRNVIKSWHSIVFFPFLLFFILYYFVHLAFFLPSRGTKTKQQYNHRVDLMNNYLLFLFITFVCVMAMLLELVLDLIMAFWWWMLTWQETSYIDRLLGKGLFMGGTCSGMHLTGWCPYYNPWLPGHFFNHRTYPSIKLTDHGIGFLDNVYPLISL